MSIFKKNFLRGLLLAVGLAGCAIPGLPFTGSGSSSSNSHSSKSSSARSVESESVSVNGEEVSSSRRETSTDEDEDDAPRKPAQKGKAGKKGGSPQASAGAGFGATCKHNSDCASNSCYVGYGELGYCTKMCDDFSDCPSFWECDHVGNAPQKICKQEKD